MQIARTDDGFGQTYNPLTLPQSSKDVSVPLQSRQLSVPTVTDPRKGVDFNSHGHRKTRARARHAVAVEVPRKVDHAGKSKPRNTRTTHHIS
jgi:hypothetical protein